MLKSTNAQYLYTIFKPKCDLQQSVNQREAEPSSVKHVGGHEEALTLDVRPVEEVKVGEDNLEEVTKVK